MRAKVPHMEQDNLINPFFTEQTPVVEVANTSTPSTLRQKPITDFFSPGIKKSVLPTQMLSKPICPQKTVTKKQPRGFNFCQTKNCRYCPLLDKSGNISSKITGQSHYTMINISCRSSNLIYCITCKKCKVQYVGQTSKRLKDRFAGHFGDIQRDVTDKPVSHHFNSPGHNGTKDMSIYVLEYIKNQHYLNKHRTLDSNAKQIGSMSCAPCPHLTSIGRTPKNSNFQNKD